MRVCYPLASIHTSVWQLFENQEFVHKYWDDLKDQWEDFKARKKLGKDKTKWSDKERAYETYFAEYIPLQREEIVNTYDNGFFSNIVEVFTYNTWENPKRGYKNDNPSTIALPAIDTTYFEEKTEKEVDSKKSK